MEFSEEKHILSMYSVEKEKVSFVNKIDPNMKQVEDWMADVEKEMKSAVKNELHQSIDSYTKTDRNQWIL